MIVRIKRIVQVGVFHNFISGGSVSWNEHGKMTVVFGRNRKGKTTLSSILQSLGSGNAELINKRLSIPSDTTLSRQIEISYKDGDTEDTILFTPTGWNGTDLKGRVLVFDQDFVQKNLMLGNDITRENKENLTDFILGEDGVKKSEDIGVRKKNLREAVKNLPLSYPDYVRDKTKDDVFTFCALKVDPKALPKINKTIEDLSKKLTRLQDVKEFQALSEISKQDIILPSAKVEAFHKELSEILGSGYDDIKENSERLLVEHIKKHMDGSGAHEWLRKGHKYQNGQHCPFCGQDTKQAHALLGAYAEIFTDEFSKYVSDTNTLIDTAMDKLERVIFASEIDARLGLLPSLRRFAKYIPEITEELLRELEDLLNEYLTDEVLYSAELSKWRDALKRDISVKSSNFGKPISVGKVPQNLKKQSDNFSDKLGRVDLRINSLVDAISTVKEKLAKLTPVQISSEIEKIKTDISVNEKSIFRIQQEAQCIKFKSLYEATEKERKDIDTAITELESEQSDYLDKYFDRLNHWFDHFGSDGFTINKTTNNQGDKKVYSLEVEYNEQPINSADLHRLFSESDRRNLALSFFMAKIESINIKNDKIIVFDDPVVSFDDNRVKQTCATLKTISDEYGQMIILTHYGSVVKRLYGSKTLATFIEIIKKGDGSVIQKMDVKTFCSSAREKEYDQIQRFIDGETTPNILLTLRPFLEGSLKDRFRKQLNSMGKYDSKLWEMIDELKNAECINPDIAGKLINMKDTLDPDHHAPGGDDNDEDTRTLAKNLLKVVYEDM